MSNSSLVNYTNLTTHYNPRTEKISKITIHHMAGKMTSKQCCDYFKTTDRKVSSNYTIDSEGNVGLSVEEKNRAWTSSSRSNDMVAVTIEVANETLAPEWKVSDKALAKLILLCVDICRRNGIKKLVFTGDKSGNLTLHKFFANTACPGKYLESKIPYIVSEVNKQLGAAAPVTTPKKTQQKKTAAEIAKEVIQGKWGSGAERKKKLEAAGYNYSEVQKIVNKLMKK